ncbi:MAG: histidine phosphatase family protein [Cytophagaceae bacterium]|nr:histidine phosphatase family protein [Cytophagaceae bacterium]MBK9509164.1 histidine phosphatase family protein [Cytophagaceae bacterium]MBK9933836.1 histidine phosphatase family protein [Cytophagaceae bacterium]MBL0302446.1 histidine phosphatase family protein [Cytophagaceae bacterium]MBL0325273.1 histidine phosphatase family protein [Cytophagaceae bacterium]
MKKDLYLIRHATAEDGANSAMFKDIERELISKGIMQSARMGKYLTESGTEIEKIFFSPARRTEATARLIAEQMTLGEEKLQMIESLYGSGPRAYLALINGLPETVSAIAIVGHNPDITFFSEYLTRDDTQGHMKKCTMIHLQFDGVKWAEISQKSGKMVKRIDVKSLENNEE